MTGSSRFCLACFSRLDVGPIQRDEVGRCRQWTKFVTLTVTLSVFLSQKPAN